MNSAGENESTAGADKTKVKGEELKLAIKLHFQIVRNCALKEIRVKFIGKLLRERTRPDPVQYALKTKNSQGWVMVSEICPRTLFEWH